MYALELETDIKSEYIKVPEYEKLKNKHAKILFLLNGEDFESIKVENYDSLRLFKEFIAKRNQNPIKISKNIDLVKLADEVNNDIF